MLLDIDLPDGSGLDVLRQIKQERPETIVIMITGNVQLENTISALRGGAYDFIEKPFKADRLVLVADRALEASRLKREVKELKALGPMFSGRYIVTAVRHRFDGVAGIRTEFDVERAGIGA